MMDKVQITISVFNLERIGKLHDKWRKAKGSVMAEQDINFMIDRMLMLLEDKQ